MRTKLKGQVTPEDVRELRIIHGRIQRLSVGLHPASNASMALLALLWAARACIRSWETDGQETEGEV